MLWFIRLVNSWVVMSINEQNDKGSTKLVDNRVVVSINGQKE